MAPEPGAAAVTGRKVGTGALLRSELRQRDVSVSAISNKRCKGAMGCY